MMIDIQEDVVYHPDGQVAIREERMGHSQAEKLRSRRRILEEAAAQIRDTGLESLSIATLMKRAQLTHGGFYGHFGSRSSLLAQALEFALNEGEATARATSEPGKPRTFSTIVRSYLSRAHRDQRTSGCAMAALVSDVGRADNEVRSVMEPHIEQFIDAIAAALGDEDDSRAMMAVSTMIGAIAVSRVMTDQKRADAILRATRAQLLGMMGEV